MDAFSAVVIKVKYGDMIRRFNAQIFVDGGLNLRMDYLRKKILSLFSFSPDTELILTYIDEDNDVVNLIDDDDIHEVVKQCLNPLRITVKKVRCYSGSSESSTPLGTPQALSQPQMQYLQTGVSEILRTMPHPMHDTLVKLTVDLASKAFSAAPGIIHLVDHFSKVGVSYLGQLSDTQPRVQPSSRQGGVPGDTASIETKDSEVTKIDPLKDASKERSELSSRNYSSLEKLKPETAVEGLSFGLNAGVTAVDSQNVGIAHPSNDSLQNPALVHLKLDECPRDVGMDKMHVIAHVQPFPTTVLDLQKSCDTFSTLQSVPNIVATSEEGNKNSEPEINHVNIAISDPKSKEYCDVRTRTVLPDILGKSPGSIHTPALTNEFVASEENFPPPSTEASSVKSISRNDDCQKIIHRGVHCDVCGVHPITGPRFKSKVVVNYDLCNTCFESMGDESDYIRMDVPVVYRSHVGFKDLSETQVRNEGSAFPQIYSCGQIKPMSAKLDSCFIQDVNVTDGTLMAPITPFTKIWRMKNNGTVAWQRGTQLVWIGGDRMTNKLSVELNIPVVGLSVEQEFDVMVDFVSPAFPGQYISYWRMAAPSGEKFGQHVWVLIQVDKSIERTPHESIRNLNLNLPPEIVNGAPEPLVEVPSVTSPTIDCSDFLSAIPPFPPMLLPLTQPTQFKESDAVESPVDHLSERKQAEKKYLRLLNEMGFKLVDLNKEILRLNDYNLKDTLADLCGVTDRNAILE